jgi:hypothetical protein
MSQIRRLAAILAAPPHAMNPPGVGWHSAGPLKILRVSHLLPDQADPAAMIQRNNSFAVRCWSAD